MKVKLSEILEKHSDLVSYFKGPKEAEIELPGSMETPQKNAIIYLSKPEFIKPCIENGVAALVISSNLKDSIEEEPECSVLVTENIHTAMALINTDFFPTQHPPQAFGSHNVHPSAVIADCAQIASGVILGPNVVIEEGVEVASGVKIGPNSCLRQNSKIHANVSIGANVVIEPMPKLARAVTCTAMFL